MRAILLNNIRSLVNVGTIFRSADGAGIERIYLCGYTPTPPRREIAKVSLGSENTVSWEYYKNPHEVLEIFRKQNIPIFSLETGEGSVPIGSIDPPKSFLCIVGNERTGIDSDLLEGTIIISLPMLGEKESLNVGVASSIALYTLCGLLSKEFE